MGSPNTCIIVMAVINSFIDIILIVIRQGYHPCQIDAITLLCIMQYLEPPKSADRELLVKIANFWELPVSI